MSYVNWNTFSRREAQFPSAQYIQYHAKLSLFSPSARCLHYWSPSFCSVLWRGFRLDILPAVETQMPTKQQTHFIGTVLFACKTVWSMPERFVYTLVQKRCYINTLPFRFLSYTNVTTIQPLYSHYIGQPVLASIPSVSELENFVAAKFYCPCWWQLVHWDQTKDASILLNGALAFKKDAKLEMWANAHRDGCPAEHRWRPLFNAAKFGWRPLLHAVQ